MRATIPGVAIASGHAETAPAVRALRVRPPERRPDGVPGVARRALPGPDRLHDGRGARLPCLPLRGGIRRRSRRQTPTSAAALERPALTSGQALAVISTVELRRSHPARPPAP